MTRSEVVELTARERVVERICANITHLPQGSADLQDLSQIVYLGLLDYPEPLLVDLYQNKRERSILDTRPAFHPSCSR